MLLSLASPLLLAVAPPLAWAPQRARPLSMVAADPSQLYGKLDAVLRRARGRAAEGGLVARASRCVSGAWTESPPERLVETTLVSGKLLLESFDEGLELLFLAEEESELSLSSSAYASLMRIGLLEERPADVLALLGRLQARGTALSAGALLSGMKAAAALDDWGAVARLHALPAEQVAADGADADGQGEAGGSLAGELEVVSPMPAWTDARLRPPPAALDGPEALELALRAHCERGDVARALGLVETMRGAGRPLPPSAYSELARLARRVRSPGPLLALSPLDLIATAGAEAEPVAWGFRNQLTIAGSQLGTVERAAVAAVLGFLSVYALATAAGLGAPSPSEVDPFAGW